MSREIKLSLYGMYCADNTMFDLLAIPNGVNKEDFVDGLLLDTMDRCVNISDPDAMKYAIGVWSRQNVDEWERIVNALQAEYDPIENYNRVEETNRKTNRENETESENHFTGSSSGTNQTFKTSYDSGELAQTDEGKNAGTDTNTTRYNGSDTGEDKEETKSNIHGNIGVMTNQQMIEQEIALRTKQCIYDIIENAFIKKFILLIY